MTAPQVLAGSVLAILIAAPAAAQQMPGMKA